MSDTTKQSLGPQLAPQIYKALTDNITFAKKQQWAITNYTVLVYAGLVGLKTSFGGASACERLAMTILAAATGISAIVMLGVIQHNMGGYRDRLQSMHNHFLTEDERTAMGIKPYEIPSWRRGLWFVGALIGVIGLGVGLVIWSLWR